MTEAERIDIQRRDREAALLLALALLWDDSRTAALRTVSLGFDPAQSVRNIWMGSPKLKLPGAAIDIQQAMAEAHIAGAGTALRLAGLEPARTATEGELADFYQPEASEAVGRLLGRLIPAVEEAEQSGDTLTERRASMKLVFDKPGTYLKPPSTQLILQGYGDGMSDVMLNHPDEDDFLLTHHTIVDEGTTKICFQRKGLTLPRSEGYWKTNWPSLHFGCRSVVLPAEKGAKVSDWLPTIPPAPGFGGAWPAWTGISALHQAMV